MQAKKLNYDLVLKNYSILGAQRNCRILGVFTRKAMRDGNNDYLNYISLVKNYLEYNLFHEVLEPFKLWLKQNL